MSDDGPPLVPEVLYNQRLSGVYGEIGEEPSQIRFLQTAVTLPQADSMLTLVAEIPESVKWPVRQLFQRDIDVDRVTEEIIPYLREQERVKFFNPLTIALMPRDEHKHVASDVAEVISRDQDFGSRYKCNVIEARGYYSINKVLGAPQYSLLEWNTEKTWLIAVDGQHRLSALKRLFNEAAGSEGSDRYRGWSIPVVILVIPPQPSNADHLLQTVRDIFVTINREAKHPTRARTILLNDFSVTAVCCQEFLDYCHKAETPSVPLAFFDWRAHSGGAKPENQIAMFRIEELEDIHIHYILGEDDEGGRMSGEQRDALLIADMEEPLDECYGPATWTQIRHRYVDVVLPAMLHVFSKFQPFSDYIRVVKEALPEEGDDVSKLAVSELRYGMTSIPQRLLPPVGEMIKEKLDSCRRAKAEIPDLFSDLVGPRGLFCGLWLALCSRNKANNEIVEWLEGAEWYTKHMNSALQLGFFNVYSTESMLGHITYDPSDDKVVNYRLGQQQRALGAYCALLACAFSKSGDEYDDEIEEHFGDLSTCLLRGYRKQVRPDIKEQNPNATSDEIRRAVNMAATEKKDSHIARIRQAIERAASD